MAIDQCEAREARRRESRNASLMTVKRRLMEISSELDFLIMSTPTSDRRNTFTDVNIHVLEAVMHISTLSSEES